MNILIIRNYPSYVSVEKNTYNIQEVGLAKALVRRGHNCDIIFWTDKSEKEVSLQVSGTEEKTVTIFYKRGITALKNTVYKGCESIFEKYDILQPCEYNQIEAWLLARKHPKKTVIYHGPYYSPFNKHYNLMCKAFDTLFLGSYKKRNTQFIVKSILAKHFLEKKGIANVDVVGVGIDAEMLVDKDNNCNEEISKTINNDKAGTKFLYVGKFEERRNIPFIFKVFAQVNKSVPSSKLYMIGTGDKEYVSNVWESAKQFGIYESIVWQEKIEQKYLSSIYEKCDFFLLPTEYEIFGMVLLEAMYYKNVVVTNTNGGSSTIIKDGVNGVIDDSGSVESWAKRIIGIINNKHVMESIKKEASETISEYYTWDKLAEIFEKCYAKRLI